MDSNRAPQSSVTRFLIAFSATAKAMRLYPRGNPQVLQAIERLQQGFASCVSNNPPLRLDVDREGFPDATPPTVALQEDLRRLAFKLHCLDVQELTITAEATVAEFEALATLLNLPFDTLRALGPIDRSLASRGVSHVSIGYSSALHTVEDKSQELQRQPSSTAEPVLKHTRHVVAMLEDPGAFAKEMVRLLVQVVPDPGQGRLDAQLAFIDRFLELTVAAIDSSPGESRPRLYENLTTALNALIRATDVSGARVGGLPTVDLTHVDRRVLQVLPERDLVKELSSKVKLHQGATTVMTSSLRALQATPTSPHARPNPVLSVIDDRRDAAGSVASNLRILEDIQVGAEVDGEYPGIVYAERDRNKNFSLGVDSYPSKLEAEDRRATGELVAALADWRPEVDSIETILDMLANEHSPAFLQMIAERLAEKLAAFLERGDLEPALHILRGLNVERRQRRDDPPTLGLLERVLEDVESPDNLANLLQCAEQTPIDSPAFDDIQSFLFLLDKRVIHSIVEIVARDRGRFSQRRIFSLAGFLCRSRIDLLAEGLRSDKSEVVRTVTWLLGQFGSPALVHLKRVLRHPDHKVRREAVRALATLAGDEGTNAITAAMEDHDDSVVGAALRALIARGASGANPVIERALLEPSTSERSDELLVVLVRAAGQLGTSPTLLALQRFEARAGLLRRLRSPALRDATRAAMRDLEIRLAKTREATS